MSVGLILKSIPQTCMGCQFNPNYDLCVAAAREIEVDPYGRSRPDWCPLQELELVPHGIYKMIDDNGCWFNECSVCGNRIEFGYMLQPYCPNCGAKIDGGTE